MQPVEQKPVSLGEFWDLLEAHDWYFDFSDSHATYKRGHANRERLLQIAKVGGAAYRALYDAYEKHAFGGGEWDTEARTWTPNVPKPARPE